MTNNKIQIIVIVTVLFLAGGGLLLLMNPDMFSPAREEAASTDVEANKLFDGDDEIAHGDDGDGDFGSEEVVDGEEKQRDNEIVPPDGNPHVEELNARIKALGEAEWSKKDYIRLRSDIEGKRDAGLISTKIAKSLSGNLFNAYLITVKEAALKVIRTSSNLRDLWPPHKELKRLKPMVTDTRVTEVTDMTHAIYTIPYYTDRLEKDIAKGDMTDEGLMKEAKKVGGKIEGLPQRFALFRTSPLVKAVCVKGKKDLGKSWGNAIMAMDYGKVEDYAEREEYDEARSDQYNSELTNFSTSVYLKTNTNFSEWVAKQQEILQNHRLADRRYKIGLSSGGNPDCDKFSGFNYYLEKCKGDLLLSPATNN